MRAAARLAVEPVDLDDPHEPVGRRRRRDRARAQQPACLLRVGERHVARAHRQIAAHDIVHFGLQRAQAIVIGVGQIEIDARGAIGVHLHARHERAVEIAIDERVEHVQIGMQLAHRAAERGVDARLHVADDLDAVREFDPEAAAVLAETGDGLDAAFPSNRAQIGQLAAAARIERMPRQAHCARPRVDHRARKQQRVGVVLTEQSIHKLHLADE